MEHTSCFQFHDIGQNVLAGKSWPAVQEIPKHAEAEADGQEQLEMLRRRILSQQELLISGTILLYWKPPHVPSSSQQPPSLPIRPIMSDL